MNVHNIAEDAPLQAYLDTNALLEFRPPRDLDWAALLGEPRVVLVVCPVVTEELQRIKDGGARDIPRRKRQRAGEILNSLERDFFPEPNQPAVVVRLTDSVEIRFDGLAVPDSVFVDYTLDAKLLDDRLVAAAIAARDSGQRVCVVANDAGARWQAKNRGIAAYNLPENWRVRGEPDAVEAELRDVRKRLAAFESRMPTLSLRTTTGHPFLRWELPKPRLPIAEHVEGHMELLRFCYGHYGEGVAARFGGLVRDVFAPPARGEIERYNKRIDAFLEKAKEALPKIIAYRNDLDLYIPLDGVVVANDGTQPAEQVRVVIRSPSGVAVVSARPIEERPRFPEPPAQPKSVFDAYGVAMEMNTLGSQFSPALYSNLFDRDPISSEPEWDADDDEAGIAIGTLRHHDSEELPTLWLKLSSYDAAAGLRLEYEISAYNLPHRVTGSLDIHVVKAQHMRPLDVERWNRDDFEDDSAGNASDTGTSTPVEDSAEGDP